jgi:integrase/recombinase XerD
MWDRVLDDFLFSLSARRNWTGTTFKYHRARLRPFVAFLVERNIDEPAAIGLRDIERFLAERGRAGLAWSTLNGTYISLGMFFHWLARAGLVERDLFNDPASEIGRPEEPRRVQEPAPVEAIEAMIAAAAADTSPYGRRDEAVMRVLRNTGIRRQELVNLRLNDFEPATRKLTIRRGGKYGHQRMVFVHPATARAINAWRSVRPRTLDPALFVALRANGRSRIGARLAPNAVNRLLIRWRKAANLPPWAIIHPHAWRHRYGTDFSAAGGDVLALQPLLGHSDIRMTRRYVTYNEEVLRKMSDLFSPGNDLEGAEKSA